MWMLTLRESVGPSVECKETNCACIPKEAYINLELRNKELLIKVGVVNSIILDVIAN